ncbi:lysophospholipase 2 [Spathaspora passalidarum NRRL Y-27907]|uniref:Lysophospholipase n=1 Tax=Spathaspora passalidarum (strain NRRL Y-27907 / 11-Y1) TaxID=619300 RepID=G3AU53_SPAPN|nr:lysophospholipase 2 [Spathaspora passalidarum NRRL Y-27907]EGW30429.1 lysophospholipase 2 [Spathaspora passalidarum NRRL Y-27907]
MHVLAILLLIQLAIAISPTKNYTPGKVKCPGGKLTREANGICASEVEYVNNRKDIAKTNLRQFLKSVSMRDFDVDGFLDSGAPLPVIGMAFSGGGYRAMLCGAGQISAYDSRVKSKDKTLAGLLQSTTYLSGLSGGNWLVGSLISNNFISIDEVLAHKKLWDIDNALLDYYGDNFIANKIMWAAISMQVWSKDLAGFETSMTDIWGRALSYPLLAATEDQGDAFLLSDVTSLPAFKSYDIPFPILVADGRAPNSTIINLNSTVFEITPYEVGSFDPSLNTFVQTKYLGTQLDDGVPKKDCINGYDNAGFLMGTSSSLFNQFILQLDKAGLPPFINDLIKKYILDPLSKSNEDVANYNPNPFYKSTNPETTISGSKILHLVDGGEDGQNVPLLPLLNRKVDIIFAHDNSNDHKGFPDGTSLIATYERQFVQQGKSMAFPYVPGQSSFRNLNLTSKPTFFGCDAKNLSTLTDNIYDVPLVVYIGNRPFSYWSNTSTFKMEYKENERRGMIKNGYEVATRKNGTLDSDWAACVGCAIIRRQQERTGQEQSEQCKQCFKRYCWDGTIYKGADIGENYDDEGLTLTGKYYNGNNIPGIKDGGTELY